jgi:Glycosyltransferase family 87
LSRVFVVLVRALALPTWLAVAGLCWLQWQRALTMPNPGYDLTPLYRAGWAVRRGQSVYDVHMFVYPPTAGAMALPLTAGERQGVLSAGIAVAAALIVAVAALSVLAFLPPGWWRLPAAGCLALGMVGSALANQTVRLANVSLLLAPLALTIVWLWARRRWNAGCALLAATLLLKPLLAPLLVIPLLARRWRPVLASLAVSVALLIVTLPLAGGPGRLREAIDHVAHGSVLVGRFAVLNLSLSGFSTVHHLPGYVVLAARLAVVAACGLAVIGFLRRRRAWDLAELSWLSAVLLLAVFLAGSLSENHYLLILVPAAVAVVAVSNSGVARVLGAVALLLMMVPLWRLHPATRQELWLAAEVLLLVAVVLASGWREADTFEADVAAVPQRQVSEDTPLVGDLEWVRLSELRVSEPGRRWFVGDSDGAGEQVGCDLRGPAVGSGMSSGTSMGAMTHCGEGRRRHHRPRPT